MKFEIKEYKNAEVVKELVYKLRKFESKFDAELKPVEEITEKLLEWMKRKLKSPNAFLFVAFSENIVIGYIFGWIEKRSKNYWKTQRYGYICDLFVKEEFRKKGIGKALIEKAEKWFKEKGIEDVHLEVYAQNPNLEFYEKLKYKEKSIRLVKNLKRGDEYFR